MLLGNTSRQYKGSFAYYASHSQPQTGKKAFVWIHILVNWQKYMYSLNKLPILNFQFRMSRVGPRLSRLWSRFGTAFAKPPPQLSSLAVHHVIILTTPPPRTTVVACMIILLMYATAFSVLFVLQATIPVVYNYRTLVMRGYNTITPIKAPYYSNKSPLTRVRLYINSPPVTVQSERLQCSLLTQPFNVVNILISTVVPLSWVALWVLVSQARPQALHYCTACKILEGKDWNENVYWREIRWGRETCTVETHWSGFLCKQSVCQSVCLSVCQSVCLSVCQSVCQPVCLSACLSVPCIQTPKRWKGVV